MQFRFCDMPKPRTTDQTIYPCACEFHAKAHGCVFQCTNRRTARHSSREEPYKMNSSIKLYFHTSKTHFLPLLLTKCSYAKKIEAGKLISIIHLVNLWYIRLGWKGYRTQHSFLPFTCAIHLNLFGHSLNFSYIHIIASIITLVSLDTHVTFCQVLNL
jgi:hypothetical protein